jgi:hypothetical protein
MPADINSELFMCSLKPEWRFDCYPEPGASNESCLERNCCWDADSSSPGEPYCFFSKSFTYYKWGTPISTQFGLHVDLSLVQESPYPNNIKNLTLHVYYETEGSVRIKVWHNLILHLAN